MIALDSGRMKLSSQWYQASMFPLSSSTFTIVCGTQGAFCSIKQSVNLDESESHSVMSDSLRPHELYSSWNSPGQNTGVGSLSLVQGLFPTQESNQVLLHCRRILYQLSYQGRIASHLSMHPFGMFLIFCYYKKMLSSSFPSSM